jgi:hypothetical protein
MGRSSVSLEERFNKKYLINEKTHCWMWKTSFNNLGYGFIRDGDKMRTAHRVSYELYKGDIPSGICVIHACDNPGCVNPDHLSLGTQVDISILLNHKNRKRGRVLGTKQPIGTCKHCGVTKPVNILAKSHNDKCKLKHTV